MDSALDREPLEVEFLFYYTEDSGAGGHRNDLESATLTFVIGRNPSDPSRYLAQLLEIEGAAHGSRFYANRLRVRESASGRILAPDLSYPLASLVEEMSQRRDSAHPHGVGIPAADRYVEPVVPVAPYECQRCLRRSFSLLWRM